MPYDTRPWKGEIACGSFEFCACGESQNKPFCGVGAQISSMIQEKCFDDLDAPVLRISAVDAPAIYSPPLEKLQLPIQIRSSQRCWRLYDGLLSPGVAG